MRPSWPTFWVWEVKMTIRQLQAAYRTSLYHFVRRAFVELYGEGRYVDNWAVRAMCVGVQKASLGEGERLLVTVPPRHLKSFIVSICLPAWLLGRDPRLQIIVASYASLLGEEHSRDFRRLIESQWYRSLFPHLRVASGGNRASQTVTTRGGGRLAVGRGGSVTGFGCDVLIVDDLLKADEARSPSERENAIEFYTGSLLSRFNDPQRGSVIIIQQRLHEDDLAGHVLSRGGFDHMNLPSISVEAGAFDLGFGRTHRREVGDLLDAARFPQEALDQKRREMGSFLFSAQYQQNPTPPGGGRNRWEWFETYEGPIELEQYERVYQSWDTAWEAGPSNDYSVCLTFGYRAGKWDLMHVLRQRLEYTDLLNAIEAQQELYGADTVIIERSNGITGMVEQLKQRSGRSHIWRTIRPVGNKEFRMISQTGWLEDGMIRMPSEAPWLADFRHEYLGFPNTKYDDQVDALSQFIKYVKHGPGRSFLDTNPETGRRTHVRRRSIPRR